MPASAESDISSTQSTQPRDPMSLVLEDACTISYPASEITKVSLGGDAISDGSDLPTGPCALRDEESGVQVGSYYHHKGWVYHEVPIEDYLRADISRRIGRVVSKPEYSVYHALLRSSDAWVKDACQALVTTAGAGRWDELRRRCQSYRIRLAGNQGLKDDLKQNIGITLLSGSSCSFNIHSQSQIFNPCNSTSEHGRSLASRANDSQIQQSLRGRQAGAIELSRAWAYRGVVRLSILHGQVPGY
jgi:hypothetical protein